MFMSNMDPPTALPSAASARMPAVQPPDPEGVTSHVEAAI